MTTSLADNRAARDAILGRVRRALRKTGPDTAARADAEAYLAAHAQGPRPAMPADLVARFLQRATDMASTVERIGSTAEIPAAVARYLDALELPPELAAQKSDTGVCWPEFVDLDWSGAGLSIEARPTTGHDRLAITGSFCAIAETGTLVFTTSADNTDGVGVVARYTCSGGSRGPRGLRDGGSIRAGSQGARRHAARDEHDFRSFTYRRHRADDRAWRTWALSRPSIASWLNEPLPGGLSDVVPLMPLLAAIPDARKLR